MKISDYIQPSNKDLDININTSKINISVDSVKEIAMNNINTDKKSKMFKRAICGAVCVALVATMGISVYATSPEVKEFVDSIFQRNKQDIDNHYSQEERALIGDNLHINGTENTIETFEDIDISLNAVINKGNSAKLMFTLDFSNNSEIITKLKDNEHQVQFETSEIVPTENVPFIISYSCSGFDINADNNTLTYFINVDNIETGISSNSDGEYVPIKSTDLYTVNLSNLNIDILDNKYNVSETIALTGNFSTEFCFGEPAPMESVTVDKDVTWNFQNDGECIYPAGDYDFHVNYIEYNNLTIKIDLDCLFNNGNNNGVIYNDDGSKESMDIALNSLFFSFNLMKLFYGDGERDTCPEYENYCALKLIDNGGNTIIQPYDVISEENDNLKFEFITPIDINNIKAIEFCGEEIPIE